MKDPEKPSPRLTQQQVQRQDLRLFAVLSVPEEDFLRQAAELEADPLFARLTEAGPDGRAPLRRRRLTGASYAFSLACGDEALAAASSAGGTAGEWLAARPAMLELARRAGEAAFYNCFLSGLPLSPEAAARECGLSAAEARELRGFVDAFLLAHERVEPAALPPLFLRCAARISRLGGKLRIEYTHPSYLRGSYAVDGGALSRLLRSGGFSQEEAARARALAARAQRLGWRKAGLHKVLSLLVERQKQFLLGAGGLLPFSQRELAAEAGLNPGTVSRLISGRTLLSPAGEELKLKDLFRAKNNYIIEKMREILLASPDRMTDLQVAQALRSGYGVRVSRRSVSLYRSKAGI